MSDHQAYKPYAKSITDIGRPSKFTPERRAAILHDISRRVPYEFAAEANGICEDTLYEWIKIGKQHKADGIESDYVRFSEDLKAAERNKILEHMDKISANVERWQADAWMLERRWHKHFGANANLIDMQKRLEDLENSKNKKDES